MHKGVRSDAPSNVTDFVEIERGALFDFHDRGGYGPASITAGHAVPYRSRFEQIWQMVKGEPCRRSFTYWLDLVESQGGPPVYGAYLWRNLAPIARNLIVMERLPDSQSMRFRYFGQEIVERFGRDCTGVTLSDFNGQPEEANWRMNLPVFEAGRPGCLHAHYGRVKRRYVKSCSLTLPLKDPATGDIRFAIVAVSYLDVTAAREKAPLTNVLGGFRRTADTETIGRELYRHAAADPLLEPVFREYSPSMLDHVRTMMFATLACDDHRLNDHYLRLAHRKLVDRNLIGDAEFDRLIGIFGDVLAKEGCDPTNKALVLSHIEAQRRAVLNR